MEIEGLQIIRGLARGSTAEIHLALDPSRQLSLAVKAFDPGLEATARGERERLRALVGAGGVVPLAGWGRTADGRHYVATAYRPLGSLQDGLLRHGPRTPEAAAKVAADVATALGSVHRAGFVHGDVKPANVVLNENGRHELIDFGSCLPLPRPGRSRPWPRPVAGTVAHLAPEVLTGTAPSAASDLYSLGSTLYTLIAGAPPFGAGDAEPQERFAQQVVDLPVPALAMLDPTTPGYEVCALITRLLAKEPHNRPRSAEEVLMALRRSWPRCGRGWWSGGTRVPRPSPGSH